MIVHEWLLLNRILNVCDYVKYMYQEWLYIYIYIYIKFRVQENVLLIINRDTNGNKSSGTK